MPPKTRPQPATLQAQAEDQADREHTRRLAELQTLAPLLAGLQVFLPALADKGLRVYPSQLHLQRERDSAGRLQNQLRLRTDATFSGNATTRWLDALLGLGFVQLSQGPFSITLKRGRLVLVVDRPTSAEERSRSATTYATSVAEDAGPVAQRHLVDTVLSQPWATATTQQTVAA
jgi:hypothetical protein